MDTETGLRQIVLLVLAAIALMVTAVAFGTGGRERAQLSTAFGEAQPGAEDPAAQSQVAITARDIAFDVDHIEVRVGTVDIVLDHQDDGILHNLRVTGPGGVDAATPIESGPVRQELTVGLSTAGTYTFVCDVHPTMVGEIEAT